MKLLSFPLKQYVHRSAGKRRTLSVKVGRKLNLLEKGTQFVDDVLAWVDNKNEGKKSEEATALVQ